MNPSAAYLKATQSGGRSWNPTWMRYGVGGMFNWLLHATALVACPLFSVRPDWESVGFGAGAGAGFSVFGRGLVAEAGVASDGVAFAVPVGEFDTGVQDRGEGADV